MPTQDHQDDTDVRPTTLEEIRPLAYIDLASSTKPNWAGLTGSSRWTAYDMASRNKITTKRVGRRLMVPVPLLRRELGDLPPLKQEAAE